MSDRFRPMRRNPWAILTAGLLIGCSPAARLEPVAGVVEFEGGEPLRGGIVTFSPSSGQGPPAHGRVGTDGRFRLSTQGRDGATPGAYRVAVVQPGEAAGRGGRHSHRVVDPKYSRFDTSGLERRIEPGMPELRITVQPSREPGQSRP